MVKGILLLSCLLVLSGCSGFTHTGAQKTLSEGRSARYTSYVEAKADGVKVSVWNTEDYESYELTAKKQPDNVYGGVDQAFATGEQYGR